MPALFKQKDIERALKGARNGGMEPGEVRIDRDGNLSIIGKGESQGTTGRSIDKMLGME